jgi:SAM-dependent methyltransferase
MGVQSIVTSNGNRAAAPLLSYEPAPPLTELPRRAEEGETLLSWDQQDLADEPFATPVAISGWAYSSSGVVEIWVAVDGTTWVQALHGQWRPDVMRSLGRREAGASGFRAVLSADDCLPGRHEVTVVVMDGGCRAVGAAATLEITPYDEGAGAELAGLMRASAPPLDGGGERFVPELHDRAMIEAEHQARYRWACALAAGREVLDAGCGVGWGSVVLADAGAKAVTGVDLSCDALASARDRAGERPLTFVRGDLEELSFEDGSFDLVVCFEAIEHVPDPSRALDCLRRVLRPDGVLLISSPNRGVYPAGNPHHVHEYESAELEAALRERFAHVAPYRQQTHISSLVTTAREFAVDDAGTVLDADVRKIVGGSAGEELYTVAAASDAPLPELHGVSVLTAPVDAKAWIEMVSRLDHRALLAESDLAAAAGENGMLRFEHERALVRLQAADQARRDAEQRAAAAEQRAAAAEQRAAAAEHWLADQRASMSWRMTAPLRLAKQRAAARNGARR